MVVLYVPGIQVLFDVTTPGLMNWAIAALFAGIIFASLEIGKYVTSRRGNIVGKEIR